MTCKSSKPNVCYDYAHPSIFIGDRPALRSSTAELRPSMDGGQDPACTQRTTVDVLQV